MITDIQEIPTAKLIDELGSRFVVFCFIGTKNEGNDDGGDNCYYHHTGNLHICYGKCHELAVRIQEQIINDEDN